MGKSLDEAFKGLDSNTYHAVDTAEPGDERSGWWRAQIIRTAREADFYTNISGGTWWANLRVTVPGQRLRYVVVIQKVGHGETGVPALTILAEAVMEAPAQEPTTSQATFIPLLKTSDAESVTLPIRTTSFDGGTKCREPLTERSQLPSIPSRPG